MILPLPEAPGGPGWLNQERLNSRQPPELHCGDLSDSPGTARVCLSGCLQPLEHSSGWVFLRQPCGSLRHGNLDFSCTDCEMLNTTCSSPVSDGKTGGWVSFVRFTPKKNLRLNLLSKPAIFCSPKASSQYLRRKQDNNSTILETAVPRMQSP